MACVFVYRCLKVINVQVGEGLYPQGTHTPLYEVKDTLREVEYTVPCGGARGRGRPLLCRREPRPRRSGPAGTDA